ncbi:hypothetical protein DFQ26_001813 [Actinomortierella ambigua]|nr:hypothetical protein DFQ26_001813 [Actinomortierella ambigua]
MAAKHALKIGARTIPMVAAHEKIPLDLVAEFKPLQDWARKLRQEEETYASKSASGKPGEGMPVRVNKVEVKNVDYFGKRIGFVNLSVDAEIVETGQKAPGYIFMVPAGMLDGSGDFAGKCAEEIEEECGITMDHESLVDMTQLAYGDKWDGMYPSVGGCDEFLRLFACCKGEYQEWRHFCVSHVVG